MSLIEPEKIRTLRKKLYQKAKREPEARFYSLYDKVYRDDILEYAWRLCRANGGAPGVDGERFEDIESRGLEEWLRARKEELHQKTYKPDPVRRVLIPKRGGGDRPLGIPTIRDRVVQTAAKLLLEPIFEADLEPNAYGYRPKRSARDAVQKVHESLCQGYQDVVDADLTKYFDMIPHADLMKSVARRVSDRWMLKLIKMWLKVAVEERDEQGKRRMTGGKKSKRGTPQGGVISPLLANLYMNRFLKMWRQRGKGQEYRAKLINYADDFVILSCGRAEEALAWTRQVMGKLGLSLNDVKTTIKDGRTEEFDFLGYTFGPRIYAKTGSAYLAARASKKSVRQIKEAVAEVLQRGNMDPWPEIARVLNRKIRGWAKYFSYGSTWKSYREVERYVEQRVQGFLRKRHKLRTRGTRHYTETQIYGELGIVQIGMPRKARPA